MTRLLWATTRTFHSSFPTALQKSRWLSSFVADSSLVDSSSAPKDFTPDCAMVYRSFLTTEEGSLVAQDILKRLKRRRYEKGHWDAVITDYKEIELTDEIMEDPCISKIFDRTREFLETNHLTYQPVTWLPCHAIDLKKDGELNAHVDSVKFSGDLVAGISLLSHSIMRLLPHVDGGGPIFDGHVDLYLPPLSLYALTGVARYRYSHELLKNQSIFQSPHGKETAVERDHRLSVIFRDAKRDSNNIDRSL